MTVNENQIVVYQSDNVERIEVRFDGDTVWLLQPQIAEGDDFHVGTLRQEACAAP